MEPKSKILLIYYSFSGNNKLLADHLAGELRSQTCAIVEKSQRTALTIFFDVFLKRTPKILPLDKKIADFDQVIFLAPLWAGKIASPLKALLKQEKSSIKKYYFITLCGGYEKKDQLEKVNEELLGLVGKPAAAMFEIDISDLFPPEKKTHIRTISGYHLKKDDLNKFAGQIKKITEIFKN